jgi:hypothetical protein
MNKGNMWLKPEDLVEIIGSSIIKDGVYKVTRADNYSFSIDNDGLPWMFFWDGTLAFMSEKRVAFPITK